MIIAYKSINKISSVQLLLKLRACMCYSYTLLKQIAMLCH